jgi:hypothetical protein
MVWTWRAIVLSLALSCGCAVAHDVDEENGLVASGTRPPSSPIDLDDDCLADIENSLDGLPEDFACTGLYLDVERKDVAPAVHPFEPAVPLWSDGSGKARWIYLPPGTEIDASSPNEWEFPVGTKMFKEFRVSGRRIETRIFQKTAKGRWSKATYEWNDDETAALRSDGRDRLDVINRGQPYRVPSGSECNQCHEGRRERILGFEMISLAQNGARGMTLQRLIDEELIAPMPRNDELEIGDDGTGLGAQALGWLHINCGVSCHNDNQNSEAYATGLRLKLDQAQLDGRSSADFESLTTTVNVPATNDRWMGRPRIVPGSPEQSLLYQLVSRRVSGKNEHMPPIASRIVPQDAVAMLAEWIRALGERPADGGGGPD